MVLVFKGYLLAFQETVILIKRMVKLAAEVIRRCRQLVSELHLVFKNGVLLVLKVTHQLLRRCLETVVLWRRREEEKECVSRRK